MKFFRLKKGYHKMSREELIYELQERDAYIERLQHRYVECCYDAGWYIPDFDGLYVDEEEE